jgi:AraC-like DNA-binding protein
MTKSQFKIFRCADAGVQAVEAATSHTFSRHWHEQYGIGVIHQGAHRSASGRGMVEAVAGDAITVNPGEVHDGAPIGGAGRSWRMLYFDPPIVHEAISDIREGGSRSQEFPQPVIINPIVATAFHRLFSAMTKTGRSSIKMRSEELFLILLTGVFSEPDKATVPRSTPIAISRAKSRIDDRPDAPMTLADLALETGLSRFQVLRGFAHATGLTPHAYLLQRRIDLARRLIACGTSLAEAAAASGFADQSHMTRVFVRKYGVSPGAYAAIFA